MAYKKPEVIAKSDTDQAFVGGCPTNRPVVLSCSQSNTKCMCGSLK